MRQFIVLAVTTALFALAACNKKPPEQPAAEQSPAAAPTTPAVTADTARIDAAIASTERLPGDADEAAGLTFDTESKTFANDDHSKPVFDPAVRHETDQVLYRFRKPT